MTYTGTLAACGDELARLRPREVLFAEASDRTVPGGGIPPWLETWRQQTPFTAPARPLWQLDSHHAGQTLKNHYGVANFAGFGYASEKDLAIRAAGAIVTYLHESQKAALEHLQP